MSEKQEKSIKQYLNVPNLITSVRIVGSIVLLFLPIETIPFYVVYGACGVSDGIDGFVARKTGQTTSFGKKLDSVADLVFYLTMAYKMLIPLVEALHKAVFWTVIGLMILRLLVYIVVGIKDRVFLSTHAIFNKLTGFVVFMIPYAIINKDFFFYYSIAGCVIAASAIFYDTFNYIRKKKKEKADRT